MALPRNEAYFGTDMPGVRSPLGGMPVKPPGTPLTGMPSPEQDLIDAEAGQAPLLDHGLGMNVQTGDPRVSSETVMGGAGGLAEFLTSIGMPNPAGMTLGEVAEVIQRHAPDRQDLLTALGNVMSGVGPADNAPIEDPAMGTGAPPPAEAPPYEGVNFKPDRPY